MPAIDFPANAQIGDIWPSSGISRWRYAGNGVWRAQSYVAAGPPGDPGEPGADGLPGAQLWVNPSPPVAPTAYPFWLNVNVFSVWNGTGWVAITAAPPPDPDPDPVTDALVYDEDTFVYDGDELIYS